MYSESKVDKPNASLLKIFILDEIFLVNLLTKVCKKKLFSVIFVKNIFSWIIIFYKIIKFINIFYKICCKNDFIKSIWKNGSNF